MNDACTFPLVVCFYSAIHVLVWSVMHGGMLKCCHWCYCCCSISSMLVSAWFNFRCITLCRPAPKYVQGCFSSLIFRGLKHSPTTIMTGKVANSSNIVVVMNYACTSPLVVCFYSEIPVHSFGHLCVMEHFNIVTDVTAVVISLQCWCLCMT